MVFKIYKNNLTPDAIDFILLIKKECKQISNSEFKLDIEKGDFEHTIINDTIFIELSESIIFMFSDEDCILNILNSSTREEEILSIRWRNYLFEKYGFNYLLEVFLQRDPLSERSIFMLDKLNNYATLGDKK